MRRRPATGELQLPQPPASFYMSTRARNFTCAPKRGRRGVSPKSWPRRWRTHAFRAMMSLRSDFFGDLQNDEALFLARRQIDVTPLREAELRKVVSCRPSSFRRVSRRTSLPTRSHCKPRRNRRGMRARYRSCPICSMTCGRRWWTKVTACSVCHPSILAGFSRSARTLSSRASERRRAAAPDPDAETRQCPRRRRAHTPTRAAPGVRG